MRGEIERLRALLPPSTSPKDSIDEAAERLLGDLLNLEIDFEDVAVTPAERARRRHEVVAAFVRIEFPVLDKTGRNANEVARRLLTAMQRVSREPLSPDRWKSNEAKLRSEGIADFIREELP